MSEQSLAGKRIVILGGSSGVGFAVAERVSAEGGTVFIGSSTADKVEKAVASLGGHHRGSVADVNNGASLHSFFQMAGIFDHLVFTAGDGGPALQPNKVEDLDLSAADQVFAVRFWGAIRAIQHALPYLSAAGSVTLTDGILGHRPRKGLFLAGAASGAIEHLVQGLAVDLAPRRINTVCLGFTLTEDHAGRMSDEQIAQATSKQLLQRAGTPGEAAEAYLYCMKGSYTTGQTIIVDGGRILG